MHAIKIFSQAIQLFKNADCPMGHAGIKTKITQIYTNRATSFHMVNEQDRCEADCNYVIKHLDERNLKALFRRAHALRAREEYALAAQDLEKLIKYSDNGKEFQSDLKYCQNKAKEEELRAQKKLAEEELYHDQQDEEDLIGLHRSSKLFMDPKKFIEDAKEWGQKIRKHRQRA